MYPPPGDDGKYDADEPGLVELVSVISVVGISELTATMED